MPRGKAPSPKPEQPSHTEVRPSDVEQWQRVKAVFLAALDVQEPERSEYVLQQCGADEELRREVESLLTSDAAAGDFCEEPAARLFGFDSLARGTADPSLSPGTRLGAYEVLGFIAAGGMGEVYRARHAVLGREVAIKTVSASAGDPSAGRRLLREARHASILNHRNVCTIHEVGEAEGSPFIVMELVDGQPLSERLGGEGLDLPGALDIALQVAAALEHAHAHGVIHRDLKSSNVMVDREGRAIVLDFGLSQRVALEPGTAAGSAVTRVGTLAGTLSHMAPEVLLGGQADVRSDVWSLGVLLYELTTGRLPFQGRTSFETSSAILDCAPRWPPGRVSLSVRLVVERCLAKDPDARYQGAAQLVSALEAIRRQHTLALVGRLLVASRRRYIAGAAAALLGISVLAAGTPTFFSHFGRSTRGIAAIGLLPLENATADVGLDYYAAGLTEGLRTQLGSALDIRVVAAPPDRRGDPVAIARELDAQALIAGRLSSAGGRIAVDVRLVDAAGGRVLWSGTFERTPQQALLLQAEIVRTLATEVRLRVRADAVDRLAAVRTVNPEAYEAYLKGRYEWNHRSSGSLQRAEAYYVEAARLDPTYAPAHAALADVYNQFATVMIGIGSPLEYRPRAEAAAIRALQIDPFSAEAHAALGYVQHYDLRWDEAASSLERAMELNPNYALAHLWYANLLMSRRRFDEALRYTEKARELDPFSLIIRSNIAWIHASAGRHEEAIAHLRRTLLLDSTYQQARSRLVGSLMILGRIDEARVEAERLVAISGRESPPLGTLAVILARTGRTEEARALLAELLQRASTGYVPPSTIAGVYEALGDVENAVEWIARAYEERSNYISYFRPDASRGGVQAHPRIHALHASAGLP
jgi:eukaryotic-like serine/threonine-protein kinase